MGSEPSKPKPPPPPPPLKILTPPRIFLRRQILNHGVGSWKVGSSVTGTIPSGSDRLQTSSTQAGSGLFHDLLAPSNRPFTFDFFLQERLQETDQNSDDEAEPQGKGKQPTRKFDQVNQTNINRTPKN